MNKIKWTLMGIVALMVLTSCNDYETYADQKKKERSHIDAFIEQRNIHVISEDSFRVHNNSTNLSNNEYVYMNNSGVYMQIVRKGPGEPLKNNTSGTKLMIRFKEVSIFDTATVVTNYYDAYDPDIMNVIKSGTTYTASFTYGLMLSKYSASVPSGGLVPLPYINVGSPTANEDVAMVRLIVPHTQGHTVASSNVYPYYYEIRFQRQPGL